MRYLGIAALAAAFWLSVAAVRLIVHAPPRPVPVTAPVMPAARVETTVSPLPIIENAPPPIPLTRAEVIRDLEVLQPKIDRCGWIAAPPGVTRDTRDPPPSLVPVRLVILEDGRVSSAEVKGKLAGTDAARCVEGHLTAARFGRSTADLTVNHRVRLKWHLDRTTRL